MKSILYVIMLCLLNGLYGGLLCENKLTPHISMHFSEVDNNTVLSLVDELEDFYFLTSQEFAFFSKEPLHINIYPNIQTFHKAFEVPEASSWAVAHATPNTIDVVSPSNPGPYHSEKSIHKIIKLNIVKSIIFSKFGKDKVPYWLAYGVGALKAEYGNTLYPLIPIPTLSDLETSKGVDFNKIGGDQVSFAFAHYIQTTLGSKALIALLSDYDSLKEELYQNWVTAFSQYGEVIDISRKVQNNILSQEAAAERLSFLLQDYSHVDGKTASLTQFIQKTTNLDSFILHSSRDQRGWSGNEIYWVEEQSTKKSKFFLKMFPVNSGHYFPEIFGLALMNEISTVGSPQMLAFGKCTIKGLSYFLLLETPVKGISIQQYFEQVSHHPLNSLERENAVETLCKAVAACGQGLAKFHQHLPLKKGKLPEHSEEMTLQYLNKAVQELINHPEYGIDPFQLEAYTYSLLQKMRETHHIIGLAYNDVKTIHTFYEAVSDTFSLVNPHNVCFSFNQDGELQGFLAKDVLKFMLSLSLNQNHYYLDKEQKICRQELLTNQEIEKATNAFKLSYEKASGIFLTPLEKSYILLEHDLFFIKNIGRDLREPELTRIKDITNLSLERIKSILSI